MSGRKQSGLARDKRGAVAVEYTMILVMFVIPSIGAISYQGVQVHKEYLAKRSLIVLPVP